VATAWQWKTQSLVGGVCVAKHTPPPLGGGGNVEIVEIIDVFAGWQRSALATETDPILSMFTKCCADFSVAKEIW
jgi:hypothetical protein